MNLEAIKGKVLSLIKDSSKGALLSKDEDNALLDEMKNFSLDEESLNVEPEAEDGSAVADFDADLSGKDPEKARKLKLMIVGGALGLLGLAIVVAMVLSSGSKEKLSPIERLMMEDKKVPSSIMELPKSGEREVVEGEYDGLILDTKVNDSTTPNVDKNTADTPANIPSIMPDAGDDLSQKLKSKIMSLREEGIEEARKEQEKSSNLVKIEEGEIRELSNVSGEVSNKIELNTGKPKPVLPAFPKIPEKGILGIPTYQGLKGDDGVPLSIVDPRQDLFVEKDGKFLPIINEKGEKAWQIYARPYNHITAYSKVSVIVKDLGFSKLATDTAIAALPAEVGLSFSPYAKNLEELIKQARMHGHEVYLDLPMEPKDFPNVDTGSYTLLSLLTPVENFQRLGTIMSVKGAYSGFVSTPDNNFSTKEEQVIPIMKMIAKHGLIYIEGNTEGGVEASRSMGLASKKADLVIKDDLFTASIKARFAYAEELAAYSGSILIIVTPQPVVLHELTVWLAQFPSIPTPEQVADPNAKKILLAPVSAEVTE